MDSEQTQPLFPYNDSHVGGHKLKIINHKVVSILKGFRPSQPLEVILLGFLLWDLLRGTENLKTNLAMLLN
jgi:hypothetical protein